MCQLRMIQDWGYNYLYLHHEMAITRVNLKNHSYRDVMHTPVEEFDLALSEYSNSYNEEHHENLWICGASKAIMVTNGSKWHKEVMHEAYVSIPHPKEKFELIELPTLSSHN